MKMKNGFKRHFTAIVMASLLGITMPAQASEPEHEAGEEHKKWAATVFVGGTEVHDSWEPTLGLELTYHINHYWSAFGLVERSERRKDTTLILAGVGLHPYKELVLLAGIGQKDPYEEHENAARLGVAYEIPLGNGWGMEPYLGVDFIEGHDEEVVAGFYFGRKF